MSAVPVAYRQALPATVVGSAIGGGVPPLGLGEPFALHGGDLLGLDGIPWLFSHEWQPSLLAEVQAACADCLDAERPWFRMKPVALQGPQGAGRTHAARSLARVAGVPHAILNVSDPVVAANLAASGEVGEAMWVTPVTAAMAATRCANPVVSVVGAEEADGDLVAALAAMIDPATSGSFREDRLRSLVDLGEVTWMVQCRPGRSLPAALVALTTAVTLQAPNPGPLSLLGLSLVEEALRDLGLDRGAPVFPGEAVGRFAAGQRGWFRGVGEAYAAFRSAIVDAAYLDALGVESDDARADEAPF